MPRDRGARRAVAKVRKPAPRVRLTPEIRRRQIVEAAFKAVAQRGFEGLRTRDIAKSVGINSATLHHYFPAKEDLISAVAEHLEYRLRTEKSPSTVAASPALAVLDRQIEDVVFYHRERPDILAVYREFIARAPRDRAIRALVERLHAGWRAGIVEALMRAKDERSVRADADVDVIAGLVLSLTWGFASQIFASPEALVAAARQLNSWVSALPTQPSS